MGAKIFVKDGMFYPADYGLEVGDVVDLVVVGGGNKAAVESAPVIRGGDTFFGDYVKALGGAGSPGGIATSKAVGSNGTYTIVAAGGGGGYAPASGTQGGAGLSTYPGLGCTAAYATNGGGADAATVDQNGSNPASVAKVIAGAGANAGGGSGVITVGGKGYSCGYGGDGYGAGGGASVMTKQSDGRCLAGNAGQIVYESHKITEEDYENGVRVTIGRGGSSWRDALHCIDLKTGNEVPLGDAPGVPLDATFGDGRMKTFDLLDGTCGYIAGMTATNKANTGTTYVKFPGDDAFYHINDGRFPGFNAAWNTSQVYYCNGYYVQAEYTGQTTYKLNWVRADVARERVPVTGEYGSINFNLPRQYAFVGFSETDMIVTGNNANQIYVIENWTPASPTTVGGTDVRTVTLNGNLREHYHSDHNRHLRRYKGDGNMIIISNVNSGVSNTAGSFNVVFNYKTGEVTALPYVPCGAYFIDGTDCFSLRTHTLIVGGNQNATWSAGPVTEPYYENLGGNSSQYLHHLGGNAKYAWRACYRLADGSDDCVTFQTIRGTNNVQVWTSVHNVVVPGTNDTVFYFDGKIRSEWTTATRNKTFVECGYNNMPGEDGEGTITDEYHCQGGGAGGCVAVYW